MTSSPTESIGHEIRGPGRTYFDDVVVDNVLEAFVELTAALWVCQDRVFVLERVLEGVLATPDARPDLARLIENWQPTPEDQARRRAAREELITHVYRAFPRRPLQSAVAPETTP